MYARRFPAIPAANRLPITRRMGTRTLPSSMRSPSSCLPSSYRARPWPATRWRRATWGSASLARAADRWPSMCGRWPWPWGRLTPIRAPGISTTRKHSQHLSCTSMGLRLGRNHGDQSRIRIYRHWAGRLGGGRGLLVIAPGGKVRAGTGTVRARHDKGASEDHSRIIRLSYDKKVYAELAAHGYAAWREVGEELGRPLLIKSGG